MKRKLNVLTLGWLFIMSAMLMTACDDGHYEVTEGGVTYTYWTFSFGQVTHQMEDADPKTFESVKDWLGRDSHHVFFKEEMIEDADPKTLKAVKYPICKDCKDYYYEGKPVNVADMSSFKIIYNDLHLWAKDSKYAYYDCTRLKVRSVKDFHLIDFCTATDNLDIYLFGQLLPDADPKTFKSLPDGYSKDKSHVWYLHDLVPDADPKTFTIDKEGNASDKFGPIYNGKRENAE